MQATNKRILTRGRNTIFPFLPLVFGGKLFFIEIGYYRSKALVGSAPWDAV
jgi:hypothetical protein